jgi:integrase
MGTIYLRGDTFWIQYHRDGRRYRETVRSSKKTDATRLLRLREGDAEKGIPITPKVGRLTFTEAAEDLINDYKVNGKKSLPHAQRRIDLHLAPVFGGRRMAGISTADIRAFIAARLEAKAAPGEINRELALLKRMYTLAIQGGKLLTRPHVPMLAENNVRTGFFEREQFDSLIAHLPEALRPMVRFAYITGWRIPSEVLTLQWRQADLDAGTVRLDPGTTKSGEGRVIHMTAELRTLLESQRAVTDAYQRERGKICPWVFHRNGAKIRSFRHAWDTAARLAGCPGRIPHDLRRTAVRNFVRAGVSEHVAMKLSGHKTASVFRRYDIVSDSDLSDAARKLDAVSGMAGR